MSLAVALAAALGLSAQAATAQGIFGSGFTYAQNGTVGLNFKPHGLAIDQVGFVLPSGTSMVATPSGGGSCTMDNAVKGTCTFNPGVPNNGDGFILINTTGTAPASIDVTATFSDNSTDEITAGTCPASGAITATPATLAQGTVGQAYSQQFTGNGGTGPYTFSYQGALPPGITLSSPGHLAGAPSDDGNFGFQLVISDYNGCSGTAGYSLMVKPSGAAPLAITTGALPAGRIGETYRESVRATGGVPPYRFTALALPRGLTLTSDGVIQGTPTTGGVGAIHVRVTDSHGTSVLKRLELPIDPQLVTKPLLHDLVALDRKFSEVLDGASDPHTGPGAVLVDIGELGHMKHELTSFFKRAIYGFTFEQLFTPLDCIDNRLARAEALDKIGSRLQDEHHHRDATALFEDATKALKGARTCKREIEDLLGGDGAVGVSRGLMSELVQLDRDINDVIHHVQPTVTSEPRKVVNAIEDLSDEKLKLVELYFTDVVIEVPQTHERLRFDQLFGLLDDIDASLGDAGGVAAAWLVDDSKSDDHHLKAEAFSDIGDAETAKRHLEDILSGKEQLK